MKELQYIKGVGPKRVKLLNRLDIYSIEDLLYYFPRDYELREVTPIFRLIDGEKQTIKCKVIGIAQEIKPRKGLTITKIPVYDGTGYASLVWFNQPYKKDEFKIGSEYILTGKVSIRFGTVQILSPEVQKSTGIVPIYRLTEDLSPVVMRNIIANALNEIDVVEEFFPDSFREKYGLMEIHEGLRQMHFPDSEELLEKARYRFAFEELFFLQLGMMLKKMENRIQKGIKFSRKPEIESFIKKLPFAMTDAQKRVWRQVEEDMASDRIMNRLVLGDVGSGKTLIAVLASLMSSYNGYQTAFMVPTEVLAEQHYRNICSMLDGCDVKVALLTGSLTARQKNDILLSIENGETDIVIGTHAIIQDGVKFNNLGLVITDEQHRFGVKQRAMLSQKGQNPDMLIMTATPIPRTLALVLYGDLDVSIIDEMPPGRKKVLTYAVSDDMSDKVYDFIHKIVKTGRQAYVICPLINDSDVIEAKSAVEHFEYLKNRYFKDCRLGLLHGKVSPLDKEMIMRDFANGNIDILVSTTVIEVGIDVPNASAIVIENAERFGLAQLHQLRGRVGRGKHQSYCFLISNMASENIRKRMDIMVKSQNGFEIAEKDMLLRGPGEFLGVRQHGMPEFKVTDLSRDFECLKKAREAVEDLLKVDPSMNSPENRLIKNTLKKKFAKAFDDVILN
ncbi:ATP-dependent DNA helicase RecG [Caldanaerobius fijiensis DSM 17918]|uniref:ATP-dependent DNA helicase RecG n=1 Tax=Caldanaerobius fijiensis DSM 17918 TaxID=1121256 RepID=A0A1M4ZRU0_9THEO|nr:ATP-dependent DNA helicase RecG [Caldanaerobius fijiensis]SHF20759.1 ATP-dependent DNA helicase RecG [Caldanaerobius fijiensis DSM 17918]